MKYISPAPKNCIVLRQDTVFLKIKNSKKLKDKPMGLRNPETELIEGR